MQVSTIKAGWRYVRMTVCIVSKSAEHLQNKVIVIPFVSSLSTVHA